MIDSNSQVNSEILVHSSPTNVDSAVFFAIPGDINSLTGGYGYDRELIKELNRLGLSVNLLRLPVSFPNPDANAMEKTAEIFAGIPSEAIVIVDGLAFGVMDEIAAKESRRLKLIALCHHPLALETGIGEANSRRFKISETRALSFAKSVIVTSAMTAKTLIADFSVPAEKIVLAQPGTLPQNFARCNNQVPVLLTLATLTKRKGHDLLINALASIAHLPWQARFVGGKNFDPQWSDYLQELVQEKQLEARIEFVGNLEDVTNEFQRADLFVLPSHFEGYGMAFAEALAFGLPVIGTHAGALPDLIPQSAGILIPPGDVKGLTNALEQLLTNNSLRLQLQAGAQEAAKNLPTWSECAHQVAQLITKMRNL